MVWLNKALELLDRQIDFTGKYILVEQTTSTPGFTHGGIQRHNPVANANFLMEWTGKVNDLLELSLAVHRARSINHGKVTIKAVVDFFFGLFGMNPGNFSSTYAVMRIRDKRTKYLDELKAGLEEKMDEDDLKSEKKERRR